MVTDTCYTLCRGGKDALMPCVEMLPQNSPHRQSSEEAAQQQRSKHCRHRRHPRRRRGRPRPRTVITARTKRLVSLGSAGYKNERIVG